MELINQLTEFGLTRQEATIYMTLIENGSLSGYEAAKQSAISRSNTYATLSSLVDKGAINLIEGNVTKYCAIPVEEFCSNKIRELQEIKELLIKSMPQKTPDVEGYITITGETQIINKMKNMLIEAKERVYLALTKDLLEKILSEVIEGISRGIKFVIITNEDIELNNAIIYKTKLSRNQIRIIVDSSNVLTGDISDSKNSTCLFSKKKNLVDLFKDSIRNEILLIEKEVVFEKTWRMV